MNRRKNYIIPAFYHIRHNLSFAIFYVLMLSTWYPSYQVTKVNPAETLK
ncbi:MULTISPECIES: hypothetical protein [Butyricimonas]|uniref:ABC-type lipoprotein release transport system permease subunit n=1 Tax=Butyricimonas faecihominis TaxID=1472416 RepID=A0A7W6HTN5_9BACT|nr:MULTISPECIES: hypothetical protein [Butyricimonas]MBB4024796.1 ABC-type lipoprotein release transport system permease subunit [Butyricimonas faecihominis]MBS6688796.1 hypothetical protein [Sanguibacteroides justesenii]